MEEAIKSFGRLLDAMVSVRLAAQRLKLEKEQEPRLVAELAGAAPQAVQRAQELLQGFDQTQWTPEARDQLKLRLAREFLSIARERAQAAQALLREMLRQEVEEVCAIVTTNGLTMDPARARARVLPDQAALERLANAGALEHYTRKSCLEFASKVAAALNQAWSEGAGPGRLAAGLAQAAGSWRGRLKTIAVTTLHACAGSAKDKVFAALG